MSYQYNGLIQFVGAEQGDWNIISMSTLSGEALAQAKTISMAVDNQQSLVEPQWILKGFRSNVRYTHKTEKAELDQQSTPLGQSVYNCAALIPIQKSPEWWNMAQDERCKIFEDDSQHIATSMKYLSAISRQLHHSRDIGEPFDFLT